MACLLLLSLISDCILVYGDRVSLEESINEHTYSIPNEIEYESNQIKDDNIYINIPLHFNEQNISNRHYFEYKKSSLKYGKKSRKNLRNYTSAFDHVNFIYDHNVCNYNLVYKQNEHRNYNDHRDAAQHYLRSHHIYNQRDGSQKEYHIASKPNAIFDSQRHNYQHETRNILNARDKYAFFLPTNLVEYKSYITYRPEKRFNTYSNAPESIFHTQVNVNSPGSKQYVTNNFPLLNDISTELKDAGEILLPVMDEVKQKTHSDEVTRTPNTTQINLLSDLRDDGYHYDRPIMNFAH